MSLLFKKYFPTKRNYGQVFFWKRNFFYSSKTGIDKDTLAWIQQPIDVSPQGIRNWIANRKKKKLIEIHKLREETKSLLGPNLASALFILEINGKVRFEGYEKWFEKGKNNKINLPIVNPQEIILEAIDASNTSFMFESFENLTELKNLQYLNVSGCGHVDDWCLDRMSLFRRSLKVLDISGCPMVTSRGLRVLHRLRNLKRLVIKDLPQLEEPKLTCLLLEESLPNCFVDGIDYSDVMETKNESLGKEKNTDDKNENKYLKIIKSWEKFATSEEEEMKKNLDKIEKNDFEKDNSWWKFWK